MKNILLFGAGKSATCLIDYLVHNAASEDWQISIADISTDLIESKTGKALCTKAYAIDITDAESRASLISQADIVISMMPPSLHILIAKDCVDQNKNLLTASYVDPQIRGLENEIKSKGLLFLCEMGLDPGIDHMSAMQIIDGIKKDGGVIASFKSHCGGLVAPESDDNPWHYKISWNPRNVVTAGSAGAVYRVWEEETKVGYHDIFTACEEIELDEIGTLAWYPNRDSLSYIPLYQLEEAATFIRTTLRHPSFCRAWAVLVDLKMTDDDDAAIVSNCKTLEEWFNKKMSITAGKAIDWEAFESLVIDEENREEITTMFSWLGLFSSVPLPADCNNSAAVLQKILEEKMVLQPHDKDMVVMVHEIDYVQDSQEKSIVSALVVKGENSLKTAMAKTVGLPLGIAAKLILNGTITLTGLHIPIVKEIYLPVLAELEANGITFEEALPLY